ncbi:MAG: hypothetical protein DRN08_07305 [Thermoplasmata archaeon]|nr:MAG: hypothetical protein DRN08_07305 [Thermoplasmata archaeon]
MFEPNKELKSLKGTGDLITNDKKIPIRFSVQQTYDGKIGGNIEINEKNGVKYFRDIHKAFRMGSQNAITGSTVDKSSIKINGIFITSYNTGYNEEEGNFLKNIRFNALEIINDYGNYFRGDNISIEFGITNLQTPFRKIKTNFGKISFIPIEEIEKQEKTIREISRLRYPCFTALIKVESPELSRFQNINDLIDHVVRKIKDLLMISSFSQGLWQDWVYVSIYKKQDQKENLIYEKMKTPKSKSSQREMIIPYMSNKQYLETSYEIYSKIKNETGLDLAIEWYIEGLSGDVIENSYVMFYTALECLVHRYAEHEKEYIFPEDNKWEEFKNKIKKEIKKILIDMGKDNKERASVYRSLEALRRRSFNELLEDFLNKYKIGYTDLIKDLGEPKRIRNNIIHKGQAYAPFQETVKNFNSIKALLQRIILSLLNCDGINTNERQGISNPFNRDPKGDYK